MPRMKICLICQQAKPDDDYGYLRTGRNGLHPWCRPCRAAYARQRYKEGKATRPARRSSVVLTDVPPPKL